MSTNHALSLALAVSLLIVGGCSPQASKRDTANTDEPIAEEMAEPATDSESAPRWVTAEAGPSKPCPTSASEATDAIPFFKMNGTLDAPDFHCRQTGPFEWEGKQWYVQRIHSLTTPPESTLPPTAPKACTNAGLASPCLFDGSRACSKQAAANNPTPALSPAGGNGCGVYEASVKLRKKP